MRERRADVKLPSKVARAMLGPRAAESRKRAGIISVLQDASHYFLSIESNWLALPTAIDSQSNTPS